MKRIKAEKRKRAAGPQNERDIVMVLVFVVIGERR